MGENERGRAAGATPGESNEDDARQYTPPYDDPPPPGFADLGNGELWGCGTADDCRAAAAWLNRHHPEHSQDPPRGHHGPILNMGYQLTREARASQVLPELGRPEQAVVLVLADICMDTTRRPPQNMNAGARVCEDLGIPMGTLGNILAKMAARGLEVRVAIGKDKNGRLVYAAKGHALDFLFPSLPPRAVKGPRNDGALTPEGPRNDGALTPEGPRFEAQRSTESWTPTPVTPNSKEDARSLSPVAAPATDRAREAPDDERENGPDEDDDEEEEEEEEEELDPDFVLLAEAVYGDGWRDLVGEEWRDVEDAITSRQYRKYHGEIKITVRGYLRTIIANGDARALVDDAAAERRRDKIAAARLDAQGVDSFGRPDAGPGWSAPPFAGPVVIGEVVQDGPVAEAAALLGAVDPGATPAEAAEALEILRQRGAHNPAAVLRAEIRDGNGYKLLGEARHRLDRQGMAQWDGPVLAALPAAGIRPAGAPETRTAEPPAETPPPEPGKPADAATSPPWLALECSWCGAELGKPCTNPGTGQPRAPHSVRVDDARQLAEAG